MHAPFIFIGTHKLKPGKRKEFEEYFAQFTSDVVEPQEPRLHAIYGYSSPDSDTVTVVQVHPDAESMVTHMKVGLEHFARAYAEFLEPQSTMQVYGELPEELLRSMSEAAQAEDGSSITVREPFAGFDRLLPT